MVSSSTNIHTDVQIDVDDNSDFSSPIYSNVLTDRANGPVSVTPGGLVDKTTYYWRARAASTGTTGWGAWTETWTYTPDIDSGKAFAYVNENMGVETTTDPDAEKSVYENVGVEYLPVSTGFKYDDENIGIQEILDGDAYGYVHEGDVSTNTPTPHIWFLKPNSGRTGDGIQIICFGAGDLQQTFNGTVEIYKGLIEGWTPVSVTTWQVFPPTVNAYTENRMIDPWNFIIDMQHQIIEITVPAGTVPPGHSLRIRTDGP